jgi:hypothetical protein
MPALGHSPDHVVARLVELLRRHPWLAALPVVLPLVVTVVAVTGVTWYPGGDFAHTELLLRALPDHPPLIGVAARIGAGTGPEQGSTPGPALAYVLWPVYALLGSSSWSMTVAVVTLHGAGIVAAVAVAARVGGAAAGAWIALGLLVLVRALVPGFFVEPWNVWLPLFVFPVLVLLVWGVVLGRPAMFPWAVALGTFCVQTHVSYIPMVVGLLGLTLVWLVVVHVRAGTGRGRGLWTVLGAAAAITVVAWIPPVVEQLQSGTGNLRKLFDEYASPDEPAVGPTAAVKAMASELTLFGPWVDGGVRSPTEEPTDPDLVGAVPFAALAASAGVVAWRRRDREAMALLGILAVATAIGLVATARIFGPFFEYTIRWMWTLATLWMAATGWTWWRELARRQGERAARADGAPTAPRAAVSLAGRGVVVGVALACVLSAWGAGRATGAEYRYERDSRTIGGIADAIDGELQPGVRYRLQHHDPVILGTAVFGLVLELERRGFEVGAGDYATAAVMPFRVFDDAETDVDLWIVSGSRAIEEMRARPDATELGSFDPRSPAEQQRSAELLTQIDAGFCAAGRGDLVPRVDEQYGLASLLLSDVGLPEAVRPLLDEYQDLRLASAVFAVAPGTPGPDPVASYPSDPCATQP